MSDTKQAGELINWISVNDELPDSGSEVLICFQRRDCEETDVCIGNYDDSYAGEPPWEVDGGITHFGHVLYWAEKPIGPNHD